MRSSIILFEKLTVEVGHFSEHECQRDQRCSPLMFLHRLYAVPDNVKTAVAKATSINQIALNLAFHWRVSSYDEN